jgi:hypothetical protein
MRNQLRIRSWLECAVRFRMSDFNESYRLIYADEPDHVRLAGGPWAGIAKVVERATAVLEDGQRKLAEVWRSPGGAAYLAEMGRAVAAMRATSESARHNDQVMSAAADALDGKQKDFAVLSTAPIPADARERYARAIVTSLDEDYQQAVANFYPVQLPGPNLYQDRPLIADGSGSTTSPRGGTSGGGSGTGGGSAKTGGTPRNLPTWVPAQPAGQSSSIVNSGSSPDDATGGGPQLQGIPGGGTYPGVGTHPGAGTHPGNGVSPNAGPGFQPSPEPPRASWVGSGPVAVPPTGPALRSPARSRIPSTPYPEGEPGSGRPTRAATRAGAGGQAGAMVGGVPAGLPAGGGQRPWQGYRRPPEKFPTSGRLAVAPIIGSASLAEPEPDQVSTDYEDEHGNRITIRRPRE